MLSDVRKHSITTLFILLLVSCFSWSVAGAAALDELRDKGNIRIAIADEAPYGYMDNGKAKGPGPDVARYVMDKIGIGNIEWVVTPFGDLIPGLQEGRFDMAAAEMAVLPERCKKIVYSEPNTTYGEGLLVKVGNPHGLRSYKAFAQRSSELKVAILAGANQRDHLQALGVPDDKIVTIENNEDAIDAITSGNAAAYAATSLTVAGLADRSDQVEAALNFIDPVINGKEVRGWGAFAFSRKAGDLRDAVNAVLVPYKFTDEWEETLMGYGFSQLDVLNSFKYETEQLCGE